MPTEGHWIPVHRISSVFPVKLDRIGVHRGHAKSAIWPPVCQNSIV
jgi:hypothetical protein